MKEFWGVGCNFGNFFVELTRNDPFLDVPGIWSLYWCYFEIGSFHVSSSRHGQFHVNSSKKKTKLHPTPQNSFILGFKHPFSGVRHHVNLFGPILIRLEMTAIWNMLDFALKFGPKINKNITNFNCMIITI